MNDDLTQLSTEQLLIAFRRSPRLPGGISGPGMQELERYLEEARRRDELAAEARAWEVVTRVDCACGDRDCDKYIRIEAMSEEDQFELWYCPGKYEHLFFLPLDVQDMRRAATPLGTGAQEDGTNE